MQTYTMRTIQALILLFIFGLLCVLFINYIKPLLIVEGLESCNIANDDLAYKNAASIAQQQTEINDFKKQIESKLQSMETEVTAFNLNAVKNKNNIALNSTAIKSSVGNIQKQAKAKEAALDKLSGSF